jgi:hypothetical protein
MQSDLLTTVSLPLALTSVMLGMGGHICPEGAPAIDWGVDCGGAAHATGSGHRPDGGGHLPGGPPRI